MWAQFWSVIEVIKGALALFKQVRTWVKEAQKNEIDDNAQKRKEAIERLKNAKTKEEALEAQKDIARYSP